MHTSHQPLARGRHTGFASQSFVTCGPEETPFLKTNPDSPDWSHAWAWLQILGLSVNRRMFHVAANYNHNILHPMYLVTTLSPRLLLTDIMTSSHLSRTETGENINSRGSRFSFSRPFRDLWVPTSHTDLAKTHTISQYSSFRDNSDLFPVKTSKCTLNGLYRFSQGEVWLCLWERVVFLDLNGNKL